MNARRRLAAAGIFLFLSGIAVAGGISFSVPHGLYADTITVSISAGDSGDPIHYTVDGRIPRPSDPVYDSPMTFDRTTVLRAAAIPDGISDDSYTPSLPDVATVTYLFLSSIIFQPDSPKGYPTEWGPFIELDGNAPADYGMDQELLGNKTFSRKATQGLEQLPAVSIITDPGNLFSHERNEDTGGIYIYTGAEKGDGYGRGWERPASIEIFDPEGRLDIQANCGIQLHGGYSRIPDRNPKHSFRVAFRSEYGTSKLNAQLFGGNSPQKYNSIVLRTFFNYSWQHSGNERNQAQYMREMWARETQRKMGREYVHAQYVHLFLNGMYWGMYNLSERPDDNWCSANFGGKKEDYDIFKDGELSEGYADRWESMESVVDEIMQHSLQLHRQKADECLERLETLMDIDNFIDYMLINFYAGNTDWDDSNWIACANRKEGTGFKFMCWDSEKIFGSLYDSNVLDSKGPLTKMFHKLMLSSTFKQRFQDRVYMHCYNGGALTPESVMNTWNELYSQIDLALYDESARWGDYRRDVHQYKSKGELYTPDNQFAAERARLLEEYFPKRTNVLLSQLKMSGMVPVDAPEQDDRISIVAGKIYIDGKAPLTVISTSGQEIGNADLPAGIYMVNGHKILVK